MPESKEFAIKGKPSLRDIEKINMLIGSSAGPIALELSRTTQANFFVESAVAGLITTVARQQARDVVVCDTHTEWLSETTRSRFLSRVDGVAALVFQSAPTNLRLQNRRGEIAPRSLSDNLFARLSRTAKLEDKGPSRTYIAVDPKYSVPLELAYGPNRFTAFRKQVVATVHEFGDSSEIKYAMAQEAEEDLYTFVLETFTNTYEHGRFGENNQILTGLRYIRFRSHIGTSADELARRAQGFPELERFLKRRGNIPGTKRFLEITVADGGMGIVSHFLKSKNLGASSREERLALAIDLLTGRLTSKQISGAGRGLPNAMFALSCLKAFVSLRTDDLWLCRDFSETVAATGSPPPPLGPVAGDPVSRIAGTHFSILLDFAP